MKVFASLRKRTQQGVSTWTFIYDAEMHMHYAVGGHDLKVIKCDDADHLRQLFKQFMSYGYTRKLPKVAAKKPYINDPWNSDLPIHLQQELEALSA